MMRRFLPSAVEKAGQGCEGIRITLAWVMPRAVGWPIMEVAGGAVGT